jgi:hypothetical protein
VSEDKRYPIRGYVGDFQTGIAADGRQVVMGLLCPELVAYFFTPGGDLIASEARPWGYPAPRWGGRDDGAYQTGDPEFERRLTAQADAWRGEIGFQPSPIAVRAFFDRERWVGVEELPEPGEAEDWEEDEETLNAWRAEGCFTFYWAKDYLLSADGTVQAT